MFSKIPRLHRTLGVFVVFAAGACLVSCNGYNSGTRVGSSSGLPFRAFVSNPVHPLSAGGGVPAVNIMDASKDQLSFFSIFLSAASGSVSDAGMMALSPNHDRTLIISPRDSKLAIVDNVREAIVGSFALPGPSESFFVANDNNTAFVAVPSAAVSGHAPGVVQEISTSSGSMDASIPIPGAHYLSQTPNGNQILVFSDNADTVVLLTPALIGAAGQPATISPCTTTQVQACTLPTNFDRPVGAVFDPSGATAYVLNCGPECGGTTAGIEAVDMTNTGNAAKLVIKNVALASSTAGLLQGTKLYVSGTQVGVGGSLSVLDISAGIGTVDCTSGTPANCQVFGIADGFHTLMQMGRNGQLFIGSRSCNGICLSIFDTMKGAVVTITASGKNGIVPDGDVTGIAPIPNRNMVYVCQGTLLRVYDTTTDQLATIQPNGQPNLVGQAIDVKVIDF